MALVRVVRVEPSSVVIRLSKRLWATHTIRALKFVHRKNFHIMEILSGGEKRWIPEIGPYLLPPGRRQPVEEIATKFGLALPSLWHLDL